MLLVLVLNVFRSFVHICGGSYTCLLSSVTIPTPVCFMFVFVLWCMNLLPLLFLAVVPRHPQQSPYALEGHRSESVAASGGKDAGTHLSPFQHLA